jgi:hypothetical protein
MMTRKVLGLAAVLVLLFPALPAVSLVGPAPGSGAQEPVPPQAPAPDEAPAADLAGPVTVELFTTAPTYDITPPAGTDPLPAGGTGGHCAGAGSLMPPALPGPATKCARITVVSGMTRVVRDVAVLDASDADGDGQSNTQEILGCGLSVLAETDHVINWLVPARTILDCDGDGFLNAAEPGSQPVGAGVAFLDSEDAVRHPNRLPTLAPLDPVPPTLLEARVLTVRFSSKDLDLRNCADKTQSYPVFGTPTPLAQFDVPDIAVLAAGISPAPNWARNGDTVTVTVSPSITNVPFGGSLAATLTVSATDHGYACITPAGAPLTFARSFPLTVLNANDPPVLTLSLPSPITVLEGSTRAFSVTVSDPQNDPASLSAAGLPAYCGPTGGVTLPLAPQATPYTVSFNCVPAAASVPPGQSVVRSHVTFTAQDMRPMFPTEQGSTDLGADIDLANVNDRPTVSCAALTVAELGTASFDCGITDPDGDAAALAASGLPAGCSDPTVATPQAVPFTKTVTCTPNQDVVAHPEAAHTFTAVFTATANGQSGTGNAAITVTDVNRAPTIQLTPPGAGSPPSYTLSEGGSLTITVTASDPDGDTTTVTPGAFPGWCTWNAATRAETCSPTQDVVSHPAASQSFSVNPAFTVADGWVPSASVTQALTLVVNDVNRPPTLSFTPPGNCGGIADRYCLSELGTVAIGMASADADNDNAPPTVVDKPAFCAVNGNQLTCAPDNNVVRHSEGTKSFPATVRADDGLGGVATRTLTFVVTDVNTLPVIILTPPPVAGNYDVNEGGSFQFTASVTDADAEDTPTLTMVSKPSFCTWAPGPGRMTCAPGFGTIPHAVRNQAVMPTPPPGIFPGSFSATDGLAAVPSNYNVRVTDVDQAVVGAVFGHNDACVPIRGNGRTICYVFTDQALALTVSGATDGDGDALWCKFEFGDGTPNQGPGPACSATHTFAANGPGRTVRVTIDDGFGSSVPQAFLISAYVRAGDNDLDTLSNEAELGGNGGYVAANGGAGPTDPDDADTDHDSGGLALNFNGDQNDALEIGAGSDPNDFDSTSNDIDGDGLLGPADPTPQNCGPVGILFQFFAGRDATGRRVFDPTTAQSYRVVILADINQDLDCKDTVNGVAERTALPPVNHP